MRADQFWVAAPAGSGVSTDIIPFVVQTSDQTVNGVLIPKGVYMDAAYIKNLSALVARLGTAWIDNAMIADLSAAKLTVGDGTVGGDLKSTSFTSGSVGWRIRPDGSAEFNNVTVRGTVYASAGSFAGSLVAATGTLGALTITTGGYIRSASHATTGFELKDDGTATFGSSATFKGALSAATGTVGALTLAAGGNIKLGKTAYSDAASGFWQGDDGGTIKLHFGNSSSYIRWPGSGPIEVVNATLTAPAFAAFSASVSGYSSTTATGTTNLGSRTVSTSGGSGTLTYQWSLEDVVWSGGSGGEEVFFGTATDSASASVTVFSLNPVTLTARLVCTVVEGSGRTSIASAAINVSIF